MSVKDQATIQAFHTDRSDAFGVDSSEALGWKRKANQQERFDELLKLGDLGSRTVLDAGCGHGDLLRSIDTAFADVHYIGIDCNASFLKIAVQRSANRSDARFLLGDVGKDTLPETDYVIACGILSYRSGEPDREFMVISRLFESARIGIAINFLKAVDFPDGILVTHEPMQTRQRCQQLTPHVYLRDQSDDFFTLYLYHDPSSVPAQLAETATMD